MLRFLIRRLILTVFVLLTVSVVVFVMSRTQGDPRFLYLTEYTTQEQWDEWGRRMGLDKPVVVQYFVWLSKAARGDLGTSRREFRPVTTALAERIPATLQLGLAAWVFALGVGWPLGVLSAVRRGGVLDYVGRTFALFGQAFPPFWVGLMLILIFAVELGWLPTGRRGGFQNIILPAVTLGWLAAAGQLRLVRSAMLNVLDSEFVKLARAKGVSPFRVIVKHALRNAAIPPLTLAGLVLAGFISGTVVTETVFGWPGVGRLAIDSVYNNDFPMLAGVILLVTCAYVTMNLAIDLAYVCIDPRVRLT